MTAYGSNIPWLGAGVRTFPLVVSPHLFLSHSWVVAAVRAFPVEEVQFGAPTEVSAVGVTENRRVSCLCGSVRISLGIAGGPLYK